ncbi:MAG: polysaccharide deacetylase family protein, partial [Planctomycetota bacterium]|nr:polysaccharide deacetylase family protein [Planctomycetota bacterium]
DIGVHAMNHIDFGPLVDKVHLHNEIVVSRDILTKHLGRQPRYFAFPYGLHHNLNRDAFQMARDHGYAGVCSAYGAYNLPEGDPFHLQRIHGDPDRCRFLNWMTVDPRKRTLGSDYDFTTSLAQRAPLDEVLL